MTTSFLIIGRDGIYQPSKWISFATYRFFYETVLCDTDSLRPSEGYVRQ